MLLIPTLIAAMAGVPAAYGQEEFKTEPDKSMAAAHNSFVKGETKKAGEDIDKAADYIKKQSNHVARVPKPTWRRPVRSWTNSAGK